MQPKTGALDVPHPDIYFYNDLTPEQQQYNAALLVPFSAPSSQPLNYFAPAYTSSTYLVCTNDNVMRLDVQQRMIARAREAGADIREVSCDASHSPFLSRPKWLAEQIGEAIAWSRTRTSGES